MKSYLVILIAIHGFAYADECQNNDGRREMDSDKLEEIHNGYRSLVAQGKVYMKNNMSLTATKMMDMKYDCDLENSAYKSAKKCSETDSSDDNENLYVIEEEFGDPVVEAFNTWSSEALDFVQTQDNLYSSTYNISNFANLAWDSHDRFGCAIFKCGGGKGTHVVCHYGPKVQKEGKQIYKTGPLCSECPDEKCWEGVCYM